MAAILHTKFSHTFSCVKLKCILINISHGDKPLSEPIRCYFTGAIKRRIKICIVENIKIVFNKTRYSDYPREWQCNDSYFTSDDTSSVIEAEASNQSCQPQSRLSIWLAFINTACADWLDRILTSYRISAENHFFKQIQVKSLRQKWRPFF